MLGRRSNKKWNGEHVGCSFANLDLKLFKVLVLCITFRVKLHQNVKDVCWHKMCVAS